jgi:hypothetical protein
MADEIIRLSATTLPDGLTVSFNEEKSFLIIDFLSRKTLSGGKKNNGNKIESIFSVALSKEHINSLKDAINKFENS